MRAVRSLPPLRQVVGVTLVSAAFWAAMILVLAG